jgi:hypothetical protein
MTTGTTEKQDHEIAADELTALFSKLQLESRAVLLGLREDETSCGGKPWTHYAWTVILSRIGPGPRVERDFDWKAGTAHVHKERFREGQPKAPNGAEVLGCVCRDFLDSEQSFEDWCSSYGYEEDSRKEFDTYNLCRSMGKKLTHLGLSAGEIRAFAELSARL